jgi:hypothetical protein
MNMTKKEQIRYEKLYKYCTTRHSRGQLYRDRLKELQRLTLKALREHYKSVMEVVIDD